MKINLPETAVGPEGSFNKLKDVPPEEATAAVEEALSPMESPRVSAPNMWAARAFNFDARHNLMWQMIKQMPKDWQAKVKRVLWDLSQSGGELLNQNVVADFSKLRLKYDRLNRKQAYAANFLLETAPDFHQQALKDLLPEGERALAYEFYKEIKAIQEKNRIEQIRGERRLGLEPMRGPEAQGYHPKKLSQQWGVFSKKMPFSAEAQNFLASIFQKQPGTANFFMSGDVKGMERAVESYILMNTKMANGKMEWLVPGRERMWAGKDARTNVNGRIMGPDDVRSYNYKAWARAEAKRLTKQINEGKTKLDATGRLRDGDMDTELPMLGPNVHDISPSEMLDIEMQNLLHNNAMAKLPPEFFTNLKAFHKEASRTATDAGNNQFYELMFGETVDGAGGGAGRGGTLMDDAYNIIGRANNVGESRIVNGFKGVGNAFGDFGHKVILTANPNPAVLNLAQGLNYISASTDAITTAHFIKEIVKASPLIRGARDILGMVDELEIIPTNTSRSRFLRSKIGRLLAVNDISNEMLNAATQKTALYHFKRLAKNPKLGGIEYIQRLVPPEKRLALDKAIRTGDDATVLDLSRQHMINFLDIINGSGTTTSQPDFLRRHPLVNEFSSLIKQPLTGSLNLLRSKTEGGLGAQTGLRGALGGAKLASHMVAGVGINAAVRSSPAVKAAGLGLMASPLAIMGLRDKNSSELDQENILGVVADMATSGSIGDKFKLAAATGLNMIPLKFADATDWLLNSRASAQLGAKTGSYAGDMVSDVAGMFPKQTAAASLALRLGKAAISGDDNVLAKTFSTKSDFPLIKSLVSWKYSPVRINDIVKRQAEIEQKIPNATTVNTERIEDKKKR